jgi:hypothetical protein
MQGSQRSVSIPRWHPVSNLEVIDTSLSIGRFQAPWDTFSRVRGAMFIEFLGLELLRLLVAFLSPVFLTGCVRETHCDVATARLVSSRD